MFHELISEQRLWLLLWDNWNTFTWVQLLLLPAVPSLFPILWLLLLSNTFLKITCAVKEFRWGNHSYSEILWELLLKKGVMPIKGIKINWSDKNTLNMLCETGEDIYCIVHALNFFPESNLNVCAHMRACIGIKIWHYHF